MKRQGLLLVLAAWLFAGPAQAQWSSLSRDGEAGHDRLSPHYYTVRNLLRNYSFLRSADKKLPSMLLEVSSDVTFESGVYSFSARLQGRGYQANLSKPDGQWQLELGPEVGEGPSVVYTLER